MNKRLYVGNVSYGTTEETLRDLFSQFGEVASVRMISDKATGRYKGFSFVEMGSEDQAEAAMAALDGQEVDGRQIKVNEARQRTTPAPGGPRY